MGKSYKLEHAYDDPSGGRDDLSSVISTISGKSVSLNSEEYLSLLETPEERKKRMRSHWTAYATMCIMSIGFSIAISGTWPYLVELYDGEDNVDKSALGFVVASTPLGQMIGGPLFGKIGNKLGRVREILYFSTIVFAIGNVMYALLPYTIDWWEDSQYHLMIIARLIIGISSGNVSACRSYIASSTIEKERTKGIAAVSGAQSIGFVIGPAIQMILSVIIDDEMLKYSTVGYVSAILAVVNFILCTPFFFTEYNIALKERELLKRNAPNEDESALPKPDYVALSAILFAFFVVQFIFTLTETLMEPFLQDQYEWCADIAIVVVGIVFCIAGVYTLFIFLASMKLSKIMDERIILLCLGFIPLAVGLALFFPFGDEKLNYCDESTETTLTSTETPFTTPSGFILNEKMEGFHPQILHRKIRDTFSDGNPNSRSFEDLVDDTCGTSECFGCPKNQDWCEDFPKLNFIQLCFGYFLIFTGYPFGLSMSNSIFSKILGPKPQGTWMGILTAAGSLGRVIGPIFVGNVYTNMGTYWNFGILLILVLIALAELAIFYKKLVPMKMPKRGKSEKY